jgi:hypothetical protein
MQRRGRDLVALRVVRRVPPVGATTWSAKLSSFGDREDAVDQRMQAPGSHPVRVRVSYVRTLAGSSKRFDAS